jgi:sugar phosphate isomerase/epimerase
MQLCLNQITIRRQPPDDLARDLAAVRAGGWEAIEVWLRHWDGFVERAGLAAARRLLDDAGLVAAGACGQPGVLFAQGEARAQVWSEFQRRLEQCQALGAPNLVVTPGPLTAAGERPSEADLERAAENLRRAGEVAAPYGVTLGIEFLKGAPLANNLPTALMLARMVGHPHVGVLVDTFHLYAGISKLEDLGLLRDAAPARITFVHINDVPAQRPRELWTDKDRVLPGAGALPLHAILEAIRASGYDGYLSLELFNDELSASWATDPAGTSRRAHAVTAGLLGIAQQ